MNYEYGCENGHVQEETHGMNESPKILCKKCKKKMTRIISGGVGTHFKGDGWSTNSKFKDSMTKKSVKAGKKAEDHNPPVTSMKDLQ